MSRTKNAVRVTTKQGDRPLAGLPIGKKYQQMRYGRKYDPAALEAVHALHNALFLKSSPPNPTFDDQVFAEYRDTFWNFIADNYCKSWAKHDGSFFRKLADAMEVHQQTVDPAWSFVGSEIIQRKSRGLPMPTVAGMHQALRKVEIQATPKTVGRIFSYYGIKPRKGKRGTRPGTKQKSAAQGGESRR